MNNEETERKDIREETGTASEEKDVFSYEEVKIEEISIDGICGVY